MAGSSKNELIAWLSTGPKTMGWGAIMAFNRTDTNTVLLQEYIERFSTGAYLPPVEGYVGDGASTGQFITDFVMDCPRLSFEIADVSRDSPDAKLTMKVVGGTHVSFKDAGGDREATRIDVVDPLNGPELTLDLKLVDVPGTVSAGKVVLDLKSSSNFSLSYSDFPREQRLGGEHFQALFETLPDEKRIIVISEITKVGDNPIKPGSFKLRTQAAPGAKVRSAANYGDGAVLVLVAMEGEPSGGNPGNSFEYLIPNDTDKAYGATLLLSNKLVLGTVIPDQYVKSGLIPPGEYILTPESSGFHVITPLQGLVNPEPRRLVFDPQNPGFYQDLPQLFLGLDRDGLVGKAQGSVAGNAIQMRIFNSMFQNTTVVLVGHDYCKLGVTWDVRAKSQYRVNPDTGLIESLGWNIEPFEFSHREYTENIEQEKIYLVWLTWIRLPHDNFKELLASTLQRLLSDLPSINVFTLQSILFKNNNSVVLDDVALPGDMAIFGWVAPSLTHFRLDPLEPLLGTGETLQFNIVPTSPSGVTWTVHNILGSNEDPGTISSMGLYTAPANIKGAFLRVRVKATAGSYSSSALVSVVVNDITVSPAVEISDRGRSRKLSAGTRSGALSWALKNPGNGGRLDAQEDGKYEYTAPTAVGDKKFIVEEIVVRNELTGKTASAWIMVTLKDMPASIMCDTSVSLPANQIKLQLRIGDHLFPDEAVQWQVVGGTGSIANGVLTIPDTLSQRFTLVFATGELVTNLFFDGYILLPLPLFDYPQTRVSGLTFMDV